MTESVTRVLDLERNFHRQRCDWAFQRAGWAAMALVVLLGIGGLFGGDGLFVQARQRLEGPPALAFEYPRFLRLDTPSRLQVAPLDMHGAPLTLWLDAHYLKRIQIEQIVPQPERQEGARGGVLYRFAGAPAHVTFHFRPQHPGTLEGLIGPSADAPAPFRQFVYP